MSAIFSILDLSAGSRRVSPISGGSARLSVVALAMAGAYALSPALANDDVPLALFRTVHDMTLDPSISTTGGGQVSGRLVTEFTGSACAGYRTRSRFVTHASNEEGVRQTSDVRLETLETMQGEFTFRSESFTDGKQTEHSAGVARRQGDNVSVELKKPKEKLYSLSEETLFPVEQARRLLVAATAGERFVSLDLFDGGQDGETWYKTAAVIGAPSTTSANLGVEEVILDADMGSMRNWPVTISFFDPDGEMTPLYEMAFVLYENGLTRDMRINYGDFVLLGKLTSLELLTEERCNE